MWLGTVLEARIINRKIEIDLVPALRSSYSRERGRQLTVTQCSDSFAKVPARQEPWNKYRWRSRAAHVGAVREGTGALKRFPGRESSLRSKRTGV